MDDCIFCRIARGEIPSDKVYEDDEVLAFRDLSPQAPEHILVIPKRHIASCADVTPENSAAVARIFEAVAAIAAELSLDSFRVVSNCGVKAGQSVMHLHFHLLSGRGFGWPPG